MTFRNTVPSNRFNSFSNETLDEMSEMSLSMAKKPKSDLLEAWKLPHPSRAHEREFDEFTPSLASELYISNQKDIASPFQLSSSLQDDERVVANLPECTAHLQSVNLQSDVHNISGDMTRVQLLQNHQDECVGQGNQDSIVAALTRQYEKSLSSEHPDQILHVLSQKVKQAVANAKTSAAFIKKRSALEQEYANNGTFADIAPSNHLSTLFHSLSSATKGVEASMSKSQSTTNWDASILSGSFEAQWDKFAAVHKKQDEARMGLSKTIAVVADNILSLAKNAERSRKQLKDSAARHLKRLQDAEVELDKARTKFEMATLEWEDVNGKDEYSEAMSSVSHSRQSGFQNLSNKFKKHFKPRLSEIELRSKVSSANAVYKKALSNATSARKAYHSHHIPRLIESFVTVLSECQDGLFRYIDMYARLVEDGIVTQGEIIAPIDASKGGLMPIVNDINFQNDMEAFVDLYCTSTFTAIKSADAATINEGAYRIGTGGNYFGSSLDDIMEADPNQVVPHLVTTCTKYIEEAGLYSEGIYRSAPSQSSRIDSLRSVLDAQPNTALEDMVSDVHVVSGVLKLFFRELKESLVPSSLYDSFINAAKGGNSRQSLIRVHEQVNALSDASYATLKHLALHLEKVSMHQDSNQMSIENLAKVWGPILIDSGPDSMSTVSKDDLYYSCSAVEIIIRNVRHIFEV